ncbi:MULTISPECIES: NADPH-dependent FMN reductase [unclassified Janthinobacterium]|uniref:NADPH-dependent FMN reductase n=1 Tax=unclassified Janthinobacterium TaxID=2610881 RepID=UPI00160B48AB|nr:MULTISPECIES: NADPH-dependent FMN reductase [unclassified Janthinobacterium]MBB5367198.1 NAD(P)H-dependent FMN reductase [Janthinobacterium sp. K2C7]MBB5380324.1 NAD(P)H-dependent FMN reductase [Janthinobacterium sp. K2Li3]MBB5385580.1 NAD(P)H-dependent FMN reductase [Janthinobacterium sp. K2E3]
MQTPVTIFAIAGSLRAASLNLALLRAIAQIAPPTFEIRIDTGLGNLPLFNPDLDADSLPAVAAMRDAILAADVLMLASPEYAHGVSGPMKNALDWMVSNTSFIDKPLVLLNTSPRATHAQAALRETVSTMSARVIDDACISLPLLGSGLDAEGIASDPVLRQTILDMLQRIRAFF